MKLILKPIPAGSFRIGDPAPLDLFDAQGKLLLAKGQIVKASTFELLCARQIYVLEYECTTATKVQRFPTEIYRNILGFMQRIFYDASLVSPERLEQTMLTVENILRELGRQERTYISFNEFRTYDNNTYVHSVNVSLLATLIGQEMNFRGHELKLIACSGLLHDLGKLSVPLEILNKPSELTSTEFALVREHTLKGVDLLRQANAPLELVGAIRSHHERWEGHGYPQGLRQRAIPEIARIIAVADVFDALTADRPYRAGLPPYHVLEMIMAGAGVDFDPEVVMALWRCLILYPENSVVKLNTGEIGMVIAIPKNFPTRPLIRILFDRYGNYVSREETVDLLKDLTRFVISVDFQCVS